MTAISLSEKSSVPVVDESNVNARNSRSHGRQRCILIAVVTVFLVCAVSICTAGGILFHLSNQHDPDNSTEWIYWNRVDGEITIHESAMLNKKERTALMISAEAYKLNYDNSLALHDFNTGFVALRDFNARQCFVTNIKFPDFDHVRKDIEDRQGKTLPLQPVKRKILIPNVLTSSDLGPRLTEFCKGIPAHWVHDVNEYSKNSVVKRRVVDIPLGSPLCYYERWQFQYI